MAEKTTPIPLIHTKLHRPPVKRDLVPRTQLLDQLDELMRHPPQSLHLVLITRRDPPLPLAIIRAKAKMTEVRVQHLRLAALSLGHREDFNRVLTDLPDNNRYAIDIPPSASSASSCSICSNSRRINRTLRPAL